ncbi:hypothetical protein [Actinomadura formosensis]|uniref:hypothetical protein n=1 Tax=Actinomadura formosensis TaxID=60706 RepID=UPI0008356390|nr:hypothetical protein [Actinomadura formosensis]
MLALTTADVRIFLHVLAATIWVGGQITLGALVPVLRGYEGLTKITARRYNMIAWPAFLVLVLTGVWNITAAGMSDAAQRTLDVKLVFVLISGLAAFLHTRATSKAGLAVWGALGLIGALAALFFGVQLG